MTFVLQEYYVHVADQLSASGSISEGIKVMKISRLHVQMIQYKVLYVTFESFTNDVVYAQLTFHEKQCTGADMCTISCSVSDSDIGTILISFKVNSLAPGRYGNDFKVIIFKPWHRTVAWVLTMKLFPGECLITSLMRNQHRFIWWLDIVKPQVITGASVDPDLCRHMASLGPNDIKVP